MAFNKIARKDSDFYVICTLPDFCWAPPPAPPVTPPIPFPLFADLGNAQTVAKDVRLNRKPARSSISSCNLLCFCHFFFSACITSCSF